MSKIRFGVVGSNFITDRIIAAGRPHAHQLIPFTQAERDAAVANLLNLATGEAHATASTEISFPSLSMNEWRPLCLAIKWSIPFSRIIGRLLA